MSHKLTPQQSSHEGSHQQGTPEPLFQQPLDVPPGSGEAIVFAMVITIFARVILPRS